MNERGERFSRLKEIVIKGCNGSDSDIDGLCLPVCSQVRYAHTDIQVPDFSDYRRDNVKDARTRSTDSASSRRSFTYMLVGGKLVPLPYYFSLFKVKILGQDC